MMVSKPPFEESYRAVVRRQLAARLTIFNAVSCAALLAITIVTGNALYLLPLLLLTLPITPLILLIVPTCGGLSEEGALFICIAVGLNSFLWGHSVAWILCRTCFPVFSGNLPRTFLRFSLRTLMLAMVVAAVGAAWWRHWQHCTKMIAVYAREEAAWSWARSALPPDVDAEALKRWQLYTSDVRKRADHYHRLSIVVERAKWRPWLLLSLDDSPPAWSRL